MTEPKSLKDLAGGELYSKTPVVPPVRRLFSTNDYKWTRIPIAFSTSALDKIQGDDKVKDIISKYIDNIQDMMNMPMGLFITGINGVGKSSIAALVAKEAVSRFKSVYWINFSDLQDLQFKSFKTTSEGVLVTEHIKNVDLLVLDGFNGDFIDNKLFDQVKLERLIAARADNMKTTIL